MTGIDQHNLDLLITAIRHATGQRPAPSSPYSSDIRNGEGSVTEEENHCRPDDTDDGPIAGHENLAELLSDIDEFLRDQHLGISALLTEFIRGRGHPNPALATSTLLDELCFTAHRYRQLANDETTAIHNAGYRPGTIGMASDTNPSRSRW